jgi:hypothetical protein
MLRFLVAGTLRCGLAYTAQVLNRMGIACGHGWVYTPDGVRRYPEIAILGDASPLAAPFAKDFNGLVIHQVRHPLGVIGSLAGSARTRNLLIHGPDGEFLARHFVARGDVLDDAMRYYVEWNARCERHDAYLRYRIEDLDARRLLRIADMIGQVVDDAAVARALEVVPADFETQDSAATPSWSDLPEGPSRDALMRQADRYGYPVKDPDPPVPVAAGCGVSWGSRGDRSRRNPR